MDFIIGHFGIAAFFRVGSISATLSSPDFVPFRGRSMGSFPEQRLVIEPIFRVMHVESTVRYLQQYANKNKLSVQTRCAHVHV